MLEDWQVATVRFKREQLSDRIAAYHQHIAMLQAKIARTNQKLQELDRQLAEALAAQRQSSAS